MPPGQFRIQDKYQEKFNKAVTELQSVEVELPGYYVIDVDVDKLPELTLAEMEFLLPMIKIKE